MFDVHRLTKILEYSRVPFVEYIMRHRKHLEISLAFTRLDCHNHIGKFSDKSANIRFEITTYSVRTGTSQRLHRYLNGQ